jgi:hypothetical protein
MDLDFRRHYLGRFYQTSGRRGNTFEHYPVFQNILGLLYGCGKDARSSRPDAVLFWEEYHYSGKAVAEDRLDATK